MEKSRLRPDWSPMKYCGRRKRGKRGDQGRVRRWEGGWEEVVLRSAEPLWLSKPGATRCHGKQRKWLSKARQRGGDEALRYCACEIVVGAQFMSSCVQGGRKWCSGCRSAPTVLNLYG